MNERTECAERNELIGEPAMKLLPPGLNHDPMSPKRGKMSMYAGIALLLTSILTGCGGGDDGGSSPSPLPPSPVDGITVVDGFGAVRPDTATRVDLSAFIRGRGATLTAMRSEQPECNATTLSGLTAEVTIDGGGLCRYTFTASNGAADASATLNMLASSRSSPVLPPLSQVMTLGSGDATYDLQALLVADWPSGYSLDVSSLQIQGGSEQGVAVASGNSITYTPPATPDWNRIVFILKNPSRPNEDALGTLYVTVSDTVNQAPTIGKPKYDYTAETITQVNTFESKTLDLATLPTLGISDPEGRDWQLVEVQSYSATVTPVDPMSVTNKQFTFTAGTVGTHIVSYIVGDHEGGFTTGLMSITVGPKERVKDWADIMVGDQTFFATPLHSEAGNQGVTAEGIWDSGVNLGDTPPGNTIAGVTGAQAKAYCNGKRLATQSNLDFLRTATAVDAARAKYPTQRDYLVSNDYGGSYLTYNLGTGTTTPYVPSTTSSHYVICMTYADDGNMSYLPTPDTPLSGRVNTVISDGATWWQIGKIRSDGGVSSFTVASSIDVGSGTISEANFRLNPTSCTGGICAIEVRGAPTEYGTATIRLLNGNNNTKSMDIGPITFLQNAKVTALRTGVNNSHADGITQNTVIATLQDKDGNPLPANTEVKLTYDHTPLANVTVTPQSQTSGAILTTNTNSEVILALNYYSSTGDTVTINMDPVVSGLPGNATSAKSTFRLDLNLSLGCLTPTGDVTVGALTYICPILKSEADRLGIRYNGAASENGKNYAGMNWLVASQYCTNMGYRLPTQAELQHLHNTYPNYQMRSVLGWPVNSYYWSSDDSSSGGHRVVHLGSGNLYEYLDTNSIYYTCIR
jgi:hypothetical protein